MDICTVFNHKIMLLMKQFRLALVGMAVLCGTAVARAQTGELIVQRDAGGLFLNHQVAPKENFYSIGRLFNISPKVIAPFNGLALNGGLSIGQVIKIPLKDQNFTSVKKKGPTEVLVPVYRMSEGNKVLAGFLKVNKGESPLANGGPAVSAPARSVAEAPAATVPATTTPVTTAPATTDAGSSADPLASPSTQPTHVVAAKKKAPAKSSAAPVPPPPVKSTVAPAPPPAETVVSAPVVVQPVAVSSGMSRYSGEGAFHPDYLTQTDEGRKTHSSSGLAGVFKSTSGWDNGKFYALMKGVERGTVVKVTNLSNNKVVFVKVLGDIADIKQNSGMLIVLSDAAVSQLGVSTDRFTTELSYAK